MWLVWVDFCLFKIANETYLHNYMKEIIYVGLIREKNTLSTWKFCMKIGSRAINQISTLSPPVTMSMYARYVYCFLPNSLKLWKISSKYWHLYCCALMYVSTNMSVYIYKECGDKWNVDMNICVLIVAPMHTIPWSVRRADIWQRCWCAENAYTSFWHMDFVNNK